MLTDALMTSIAMTSAAFYINYIRMSALPPKGPGPLFTKREGVLPQDLVKSRSREIRV